MSFFEELKRRRVFQTAAIYVAIAWGATEIILAIVEEFDLSPWISQFTIVAFILGFPITLFGSWYVDVGARGVKSIAVLVGVVLVSTVAVWIVWPPPTATVSDVPDCPATDPFCLAKTSLAVLPFVNLTNDASNDYAARGLSDDLIFLLARLNRLRIAAGRSSAIVAEQKMSIADIGEALGVDHVLEGRLQLDTSGLQIIAQLIDARSQFVYWTRQFRADTDLLDVREDISRSVADALKLDQADEGLKLVPTDSEAAYEAYLRGLQQARVEGYGSPAPLEHFTRAVALDPGFADAHAALANTLVEMANGGLIDEEEAFVKARAATTRALELDPQLPQAYVMLGMLRRRATDSEGAQNALLRALELNPNDEAAHLQVGLLLSNQGLLKAANREFEIAYTLDPLNQLLDVYRADVLRLRGDNAAVMKLLRSQLLADPDSTLVYGNLQIVPLLIGAPESSLQFARDAKAANAASGWNYSFESMAESRLGQTEAAWNAIRQGEESEPRNIFVRISKMMRLAADGDGAGLRAYAESIIATHGGNRHWRKWAAHGALMQGDFLAAVELLEAAFEAIEFHSGLFPAEEIVHMENLVAAYRALGESARADEWLAHCKARSEGLRKQEVALPDLDYAEGVLLVMQGETEEGLQLLEQAAMRGWLGWPIMRHDPKLQVLTGNPRFEAIFSGPD